MNTEIKIIDTLKISSTGIYLKKYHIQRTLEAFQELGTPVNEFSVHAMYQQIEDKNMSLKKEMKAQLVFDSNELKNSTCVISDIENLPNPITLEISKNLFQISGRGLQNFKISKRDYWNQVLKNAHCFDVIGVNQNDDITETSRFNLFFLKDQIFYTPTLDSGCINGVYRRFLLSTGYYESALGRFEVIEKDIPVANIHNYEIFVANSLRGMNKAILI